MSEPADIEPSSGPSAEPPNAPSVMPSRRRRVLRVLVWLLAALVSMPLVSIAALNLIDPPISVYMLQRSFDGEARVRQWRDLDTISNRLIAATVASEDARFCRHNGIDWVELERVIDRARESDEAPTRGASTITMQTAKNLFLWPDQSYLRKAIEIPLAYWMDLVLSKRRILEIYLNIVEWAPGIYGAESAARHHFGSGADRLTREQASLMAAALPNPILRRAGRPGPVTRRVARSIRKRMSGIGPYLDCLGER